MIIKKNYEDEIKKKKDGIKKKRGIEKKKEEGMS
jgi:hypothetical protein